MAQIYTQLGKMLEAQAERNQLAALHAKTEGAIRFDAPKVYVY